MQKTTSKYRAIVAQGWTMMFIIFIAMFVMGLVKSAINEDFSYYQTDPGYQGLAVLTVVMGIYALMPMLVKTFEGRWLGLLSAGLGVFFTMFFIAHQLAHLIEGDKPFSILHLLDIAHHILGVWVVTASVLWVKQTKKDDTVNRETVVN